MNKPYFVFLLAVLVAGYFLGQNVTSNKTSASPELTIDASTCVKVEHGFNCAGVISDVPAHWLDGNEDEMKIEVHRIRA